ncbi:TonB-dependent receptor [Paracrocinitomix mangrovi]|uniref:TonB-dependent receptor n=1 Tax=Paracrocinitomix mangrovi TaxID=2862509 RepID=UPI001C8E913C|nr:TonB-dependent receptor [Paracrocinitomix mangrovi]UKN02070.1 TonB-dependent receptor [Paracrocinitomix mangrovi]
MKFWLLTYLLFHIVLTSAQCELKGTVLDQSKSPVSFAKVSLSSEKSHYALTDNNGKFFFNGLAAGKYHIRIHSIGFVDFDDSLQIKNGSNNYKVSIEDTMQLAKVDVLAEDALSSRNMRTIEGMTLTHGKKTQLIDLEKIIGNKSANNARELYASVPGLNIWESDGGGLQLGIGARGLSPNRTEHFNTRQNGYDIAADALGYPESYYTPPAEAIESIQLIRGAASLQFGPQFGGMLNFNLIQPSSKKFEYKGSHTYGGYNYVGTFNSISGTIKKKFSYLAFYKFKRGDGWRDNAGFTQHNAFGMLKYQFTENIFLSAEYTHMSYLAQQAGGLTDAMFEQNPRQSIRERNWFGVNWNILSAHFNWVISSKTAIDIKGFKVNASRNALGNLDKISRLDDYENRDLISGDFDNIGAELRLLQHYPLGKKVKGTLAAGLRYYNGKTTSLQGKANDGYGADFDFINPNDLEGSDYVFPSQNYSAFAENMFRLSKGFWLSAGVRYEHISTAAQGSYRVQNFHPLTNELLFDTTYTEDKSNSRDIFLGGLGLTWKAFKNAEFYGNIAQSYRGINFSDIRIINPNQQVDPNITDETGYNADLGFRGKSSRYTFDVSGFFLYYDNKIGVVNKKVNDYEFVRYRTNIGKAYSAGVELFGERIFKKSDSAQTYWSGFANISYVYAKYGESLEQAYANKWVELVPPVTAKIGTKLFVKKWTFSYLASYVHKHYTDGTNATFDPNAVAGIIPSYYVMDVGATYNLNRHFTFKTGVNNFTNNKYFTRRASGYPGPGIIPSDGISFYVTVDIKL